MVVNFKEFAYTSDTALAVDVNAWLTTLKTQGTPAREIKLNFLSTTRVLVTATYGTI